MVSKEYEYIIVGSGVAGATIAKSLLEDNSSTSILVFEAGPRIASKNRRYWWDFVALNKFDERQNSFARAYQRPYDFTYDKRDEYSKTGDPGWYFGDSRMLAYGGSTVHWGGWSLRFKPEDFEMFSRTGEGLDWLLSYDDLEPYYCRAEDYLAVCGDSDEDWSSPGTRMWRSKPYPLPPFRWTAQEGEMAEAFERLGIKPGTMPLSRFRKCMTTGTCKYCPFGSRFSADQVLDELESDERYQEFEILNAPVVRIVSDSKKHVRGVDYVDIRTGGIQRASAGCVIICAGTYESPKLLQLSANEYWPNGIGNNYDLAGRHLISHSQLKVTGEREGNAERWFQEYDFPTLMSRTFDAPQYQKWGKIFLYNNRKLPNVDIAALMMSGLSRRDVDAAIEASRQTEVQAFFEDKGRFENFLTLDGTKKTRFGLPATRVHFSRTPQAETAAQSWLRKMETIIKEMGYKVKKSSVYSPGGHHATGTCRMGATPEDGITDVDLRVHDIDNLYICSNAVFPTNSAVNPTLTLAALAFRLSDHLIGR